MSHNTFGIGTVPPPPPPMPGYPPQPPGPPDESGRATLAALVAAGVIAGVIASTAAAVITVNARDTPPTTAPVAYTRNGHRRTAHTGAAGPAANLAGGPPDVKHGLHPLRGISEASVAQGVIPEG